MKKFVSGVLIGVVLSSTFAFAAQYVAKSANFKVLVNGEEFTSDPPALVVEGRTYLPLRAIGEALSIPVNWNEDLKQAEVGNLINVEQSIVTVKGYSFSQLSVKNLLYTESTICTVDVTNNTGDTKQVVRVSASFYNKDNIRVGNACGYILNEFCNGETVTVEMSSDDRINNYSYVRYQIDSES
nr:MAG TPA: copper amine oxidase [Caudoviricetes sp.]